MDDNLSMLDKIKNLTKKDQSVSEYLELAKTWEDNKLYDLNNRVNRSESREKYSLLIALFSVIGVIYMAANVNHYIQIEEIDLKTGYRKIRDLYEVGKPLNISQQELFLKSDVRRFIECYEGYALAKRQENLMCIGAFANKKVLAQYKDYVDKNNPNGPANVIKSLGLIKVNVVNINPLSHDKYTVESHVVIKPETTKEYSPIVLVVTMTYEYKEVPASASIRELNPHGFMATSYISNPKQDI